MADKTRIFTSDFGTTLQVQSRLNQLGIKVKAVTEGRDLGADRAARGTTRRPTHAKRAQDAHKRFGAVGFKLRKLKLKRRRGVAHQ
eukprot:1953066-Pyramimonas_sp.AAC.1